VGEHKTERTLVTNWPQSEAPPPLSADRQAQDGGSGRCRHNCRLRFGRQVPLDPSLNGGVKGNNIIGKYLTGKPRPLGRGASLQCWSPLPPCPPTPLRRDRQGGASTRLAGEGFQCERTKFSSLEIATLKRESESIRIVMNSTNLHS
jgi:hypothetical protein